MLRKLRSLKVMSFALLAVGLVGIAEASQAVAEGFLLAEENQMTSLVNEHRASKGLGQLTHNDALRTVARRQAQRMVMAGYIYHNPDLAKEAGDAVPGWLLVGENVGVGPSVIAVEEAFLNSPKHRENIEEGAFNIIGLGAMASQNGSLYFTQNFAKTGKAKADPVPVAATAPPPVVRVTPKPKVVSPVVAPTPVPTPEPVVTPPPASTAPASPGVLGTKSSSDASTNKFGLIDGLLAMFGRFFAKLAVWR